MEMEWTYPRVLSTIMEVCLRNKVDVSEALVMKLTSSNQIGRRKEKVKLGDKKVVLGVNQLSTSGEDNIRKASLGLH